MTKPKPKHLHKPTGRPKRSDEEIQFLCDELMKWAKKEDAFSFDEFACEVMNVERHTVTTWAARYPLFCETFNKAKGILRNRWLKGALTNKLNPYVLNNFYYQLSEDHQNWIKEMKNKETKDQVINVHIPSFENKKISKKDS